MKDAAVDVDLLSTPYSRIYSDLAALREGFHRSGRLDDSNAKLDEVSKIFATYLAYRRGQIAAFPQPGSHDLVVDLQRSFQCTVELPQYHLRSGGSIFGSQPSLAIRRDDVELASDLIALVKRCVDTAFDMQAVESRPFDVLNEAFGHFVRDNFRSNVEDAQYMTPPEVVEFIVDVALFDLEKEFRRYPLPREKFTVLDPTCGVGSFLTTFYQRARQAAWLPLESVRLIGQDKVERMVRLSTINMELFDVGEHHITIGNSLELGSELDKYNGTVDLILTNPPFGARFNADYIAERCGDNTPFFSQLKRTTASIDSELLFVDRDLRLLRDGGRLLIVVPDGVVSAKGIAAMLRHHLAMTATLVGIIELPSTTFAQAGTRTKTAVLYIQKGRRPVLSNAFMAKAEDLGFQVGSRKGVQIKVAEGRNDLPQIFDAYKASKSQEGLDLPQVICSTPSCVLVEEGKVVKSSWTASHYSARRFETISEATSNTEFDLVPLSKLVDFSGEKRRRKQWEPGITFLSVLHILGDGFVDVAAALTYTPKTPGIPIEPGEILLSRINPRIPRVCVAPDLGTPAICSTEFVVLKCMSPANPYELAYLLQTSIVQNQIQSLTSGTSASHNRIRTSELGEVLIPVARRGSDLARAAERVFSEYEASSKALIQHAMNLAKLRIGDSAMFGSAHR